MLACHPCLSEGRTNLSPDNFKSFSTKINRKNTSKCLKMVRLRSKPLKIKKAHLSGRRRRFVTPEMDPPTHVIEWDIPVRASVCQLRQIGHTQESIRNPIKNVWKILKSSGSLGTRRSYGRL